jgi:CspA family cold shock protein
MSTGRVKFFDKGHGFGFLTDDESKQDIFFHCSGTLDVVESAEMVEYDIETNRKGLIAVNVKRIKSDGKR